MLKDIIFFYYFFFQIQYIAVICSQKFPMCEASVIVFKEPIKLHVHSLEIKELILIINNLFLKENSLPSFVPLFLFNLSQALNSNC